MATKVVLLYRYESWVLKKNDMSGVGAIEMKFLWKLISCTRRDRLIKTDVR